MGRPAADHLSDLLAKIDPEMSRLGVEHEFHSYAGAGHAFMNESRPSYREEASRDAWRCTIDWFNRYLLA